MQHLETLIAALDQCEAAFQQQAPTLTGEAASLAGNHLSVLGHHRSMLEKLRREATQGAPKRNRLDRGEFRLLFQPRLSLTDGKITGVEALITKTQILWHLLDCVWLAHFAEPRMAPPSFSEDAS